jgi:hypothetical protein
MGENMRTEKPEIDLSNAKNLLVEHRETIREAFKRAVRETLLEHKRAGNPIAVSENGEVIWVEPKNIKIDENSSVPAQRSLAS